MPCSKWGIFSCNYKVTYTVSEIKGKKSILNDIKITLNIGSDSVMVEVTNDGNSPCEYTQVYVLFYKDGELIGSLYHYADVNEPGSTDYLSFSFPFDDNYDRIQIDDYSVYVNYSYRFEY